MKKIIISFIFTFSVLGTAHGQTSGNAAVTLNLGAINSLAVSGNPGALSITSAIAGSDPTPVTNATTTYAYSTNGTNKKITGALNQNMEAGLTMEVQLAAPTGGSSAGYVSMSTTSQPLATGITKRNETGKTITYRFNATVAAGVVPLIQKTLTLTLVDGP